MTREFASSFGERWGRSANVRNGWKTDIKASRLGDTQTFRWSDLSALFVVAFERVMIGALGRSALESSAFY